MAVRLSTSSLPVRSSLAATALCFHDNAVSLQNRRNRDFREMNLDVGYKTHRIGFCWFGTIRVHKLDIESASGCKVDEIGFTHITRINEIMSEVSIKTYRIGFCWFCSLGE